MNGHSDQLLEKKHVVLYGGSFDPIGVHHLRVAESLLKQPRIDRVYIIPCGYREDKILRESNDIRLEICKLSVHEYFGDNSRIMVDDVDVKNGQIYPCYLQMKEFELRSENADRELAYAVGGDLVTSLRTWDDLSPKMVDEYFFYIISRTPKASFPRVLLPPRFAIIPQFDSNDSTCSSTFIKEQLKMMNAGEEFDRERLETHLMPSALYYIKKNNLYK